MNEFMKEYYNNIGYTTKINGHGRPIGHSELAMHVGMAGKIVDYVLVKDYNASYGVVVAIDGSFTDGCLNIHPDIINVS